MRARPHGRAVRAETSSAPTRLRPRYPTAPRFGPRRQAAGRKRKPGSTEGAGSFGLLRWRWVTPGGPSIFEQTKRGTRSRRPPPPSSYSHQHSLDHLLSERVRVRRDPTRPVHQAAPTVRTVVSPERDTKLSELIVAPRAAVVKHTHRRPRRGRRLVDRGGTAHSSSPRPASDPAAALGDGRPPAMSSAKRRRKPAGSLGSEPSASTA